MTAETGAGALAGWRILEVADGIAASFCAKVLADLGADVVKVDPPGGARFLYLNTGKASVVVPEQNGIENIAVLVSECDVVVTDRPHQFVFDEHDDTTIVRAPWLFSDLDCAVRPGPLMGADNDYVLDAMLAVTRDERARLAEVLR